MSCCTSKHEDFHRTESGAYLIGGCKDRSRTQPHHSHSRLWHPGFEHAYATSVENGPLFPNGKGGFWNKKRTGVIASSILSWRKSASSRILTTKMVSANRSLPGSLPPIRPTPPAIPTPAFCDRAGVNKDILKRAVGHTPKSKTLDEVYLHPKATQMIEAFDKANQLVNDEVLTTTKA